MEKKQTAVEWLIEEIENLITIDTFKKWIELKEQALEMEKEQNSVNKLPMLNNLPPSELISLKKYYDEKLEGGYKFRSAEQIEAENVSINIEKRLRDICKI